MNIQQVNKTIATLISDLNQLEIYFYDFELNHKNKTIDIIRGTWCEFDQCSINNQIVFTGTFEQVKHCLDIEKRALNSINWDE